MVRASGKSPRMKNRFILLTSILSILLGLLLLEVSYRAYVRWFDPARFEDGRAVPDFFGVYDRSLWVFDREHGFRYAPDRVINQTQISDGKVLNCEILDIVNENGNIGTSGIKYTDPEFTIAVFGDSWTAFSQNGMTWPIFLQENLERETGQRINIVNYGRDGYGLLQIMRLAADTIAATGPDLALLAFISVDIDRAPFWRSETRIDGRNRVLTSLQPTPEPKLEDAADTFVLHEDATFDWCTNAKGTRDALVEDIERVYLERVKRSALPVQALFTMRHSFVYNRLVYANPTNSPQGHPKTPACLSIPSPMCRAPARSFPPSTPVGHRGGLCTWPFFPK